MIAIIDADSLIYYSSKENLNASIMDLEGRIQSILLRTKADKYIVCLSSYKYFRTSLYPEYKQNRTETTLLFIEELRQHLLDNYKGLIIPFLEADDIVTWLKHKYKERAILCAVDKDVLKQNSGSHFNYKKDVFETTEDKDIIKFILQQVITGDHGDNIKGIPGKGPVFAEKIVKGEDLIEDSLNTFAAFIDHYQILNLGIEEFYKNFKSVYLLRNLSEIQPFLPNNFNLNDFINLHNTLDIEW
jgi:5'-3' exonuclease